MVQKKKRRLNIQEAVKWCTIKGKRLNIQEAVKWCTKDKEGSIFWKQSNGVKEKRRLNIQEAVKWCKRKKKAQYSGSSQMV